MQAVIDLGSKLQSDEPPKLGALKLTIQQFYRVNGDSTQNRGVTSDVVLPSLAEELGTSEKELDYALAFDRVRPVAHEQLGLVNPEVVAALKANSAQRIKESKDFAKLLKDIDLVKTRRAKKEIPLNEKELREQFTKEDAEKADQKGTGLDDEEPPAEGAPYKFKRTYFNNEVLQIMVDYMQGKKVTSAR